MKQNTVSIARQITSNPIVPKGQGNITEYQVIEKPPKTSNSYRTLRVPDSIMDEVIKRKKQNDFRKGQLGEAYIDGDYISRCENGLPHAASSFNTALTKLCSRAGLPHVTVHGLRHMYASILMEQGVPLVKVSALFGHASIHTIFEYYCNVKSVIRLLDRNNYAYRVVLKYEDGTVRTQQKSGFKTKKEAEDARKRTIGELSNGTYVVNNNVKLKDFLEYWLEYDIRQRVRSFNTYDTYSQIVKKHIIPFLGKKRLTELNRGDIRRLYQNHAEYSVPIVRQVKTVLNVSLRYAVVHKLIPLNPAEGIDLPKTVKAKPYHTRNIDTKKTLTMEQIQTLIGASRETPIHMQVLFNVLMGLRRQEINGLKCI